MTQSQEKPAAPGLTSDEKRALFDTYFRLLREETELKERCELLQREQAKVVDEIHAHLGGGPFLVNGRRLQIVGKRGRGAAGQLTVRHFDEDVEIE